MEIAIPLRDGLSLAIADQSTREGDYPTRRLQKGLLLLCDGQGLAEEGVGFGVPVVKRGVKTVFAGGVILSRPQQGPPWAMTAAFEMNLVERLARSDGRGVRPKFLYAARDSLAALHRRSPPLRGLLTGTSVALQRTFRWTTCFVKGDSLGIVNVTYTVYPEEGRIGIAVDTADLLRDTITEVAMVNELGAHHFDRYRDSEGTTLGGKQIGTWDVVTAARATFVSTAHRAAFSLGQARGAKLNRGRELVGSRLAWSGFGYVLPPTLTDFAYDVSFERLP